MCQEEWRDRLQVQIKIIDIVMRNGRFFTHAAIFAIICGMLSFLQSCTDTPKGNHPVTPEGTYTALFKGTSTFLEEKQDGLTLYSTQYDGVYFIPYFFKGNDGELDFYWDRKTNRIEVYESFTGIFDEYGYPVYVLPQNKYEAAMGNDARESYYDPKSKIFTFNVLLELPDGHGGAVRNPTTLIFNVTEVL